MSKKKPKLIVIAGPTAVGKTSYAISLAKKLNTVILSADSRQIYSGMPIATAQPTMDERQGVPHYLIGHIDPKSHYSAGQFEREAIQLLEKLFLEHDTIILTGGTGLYIDAVIKGLDEFPPIDPSIRQELNETYAQSGLQILLKELEAADPAYAKIVDKHNHRRIIRALEFIRSSGQPFSSFRKNKPKDRFFQTEIILLERDRDKLYDRINRRVLLMLDAGLLAEAKKWYPLRDYNSTQTVGYKELFEHFDGHISLERAIELIQQNTRRYAKRQLTWFRRLNIDEIVLLDSD